MTFASRLLRDPFPGPWSTSWCKKGLIMNVVICRWRRAGVWVFLRESTAVPIPLKICGFGRRRINLSKRKRFVGPWANCLGLLAEQVYPKLGFTNELGNGHDDRRYGPTLLAPIPWGRAGWSNSDVSGEGSEDSNNASPCLYHRCSAAVVSGEEVERRCSFCPYPHSSARRSGVERSCSTIVDALGKGRGNHSSILDSSVALWYSSKSGRPTPLWILGYVTSVWRIRDNPPMPDEAYGHGS